MQSISSTIQYSYFKHYATSYLIKEPFWELLETLGTDEALLVIQLTVTVDDFLRGGEATPAPFARGVCQGISHVAVRNRSITG